MKKLFALLLSVAMAASLFAGVAFAAAPTATFSPANAATGVAVNVSPTITFSEAVQGLGGATLDGAYLAASVTLLQGATVVPFSASLSENGRILTINPTSDLGIGLPYTLTVLASRFERAVVPHGVVAEVSATFTTTGSLADITAFAIPGQVGASVINDVANTITVTVPHGTVVTGLVPAISLSDRASVSPLTNVSQNFTNPVVYTVTAGNQEITDTYTVTVIVAAQPSVASITAFAIPGQVGVTQTVDNGAAPGTIAVVVPFGTAVTELRPTINVNPGASVSPVSGVAQNFTSPVTYTVTAPDGTTTDTYIVTVISAAASSAADITVFNIPGQISSTITGNAIAVVVPHGTSVTALVPHITTSPGASVSPVSGVAQNFTSPVAYIVTAQDGTTTQNYTVTVTFGTALHNVFLAGSIIHGAIGQSLRG